MEVSMNAERVLVQLVCISFTVCGVLASASPASAQTYAEWEKTQPAAQNGPVIGGYVIDEVKTQRVLSFGAMGMGAACTIAGVAVGLSAIGLAERDGDSSEVRSRAFLANVLMGSGVTMGLAGAVVLVIARPQKPSPPRKTPSTKPARGPEHEVQARRRIRDAFIVPTVHTRGAGVGAGFRF